MDQRVKDLLSEARAADKEDFERAELFAVLIKVPGWEKYIQLIDRRIQLLADAILEPAGGLDGVISFEFIKGTMRGLLIARDITSVTIAAVEQLRRDRAMTQDGDHDDE